jgi:hypothetical protein
MDAYVASELTKQQNITYMEGVDRLYCPDLYCNKKAPLGTLPTCDTCSEWSCPDHAPECCKAEGAIQLVRYEMRDAGVAIIATTPQTLLAELCRLDIADLLTFVSCKHYNAAVDEFDTDDALCAQWVRLRRDMFYRMRSGAQ